MIGGLVQTFLNRSFSPLACGDVFEFDPGEGGDSSKFILLVQPCDVTLRPSGRDSESGFLVPLQEVSGEDGGDGSEGSLKKPRLPFQLEGKTWACDFRKTTTARLNILDLATFRQDGKVRYEEGSPPPERVLPGQQALAKTLYRLLEQALQLRKKEKNQSKKQVTDVGCQLTLSNSGPFREISNGTYIPEGGDTKARFTWRLARSGRVRMPYAAALLSNNLAVLDRQAFDLDYLKPHTRATNPPSPPNGAPGTSAVASAPT